MSSIPATRLPGPRTAPSTATRPRPESRPGVQAGGTPVTPAPPAPAPPVSVLQQLAKALSTFLHALASWLGALFRPSPATPPAATPAQAPAAPVAPPVTPGTTQPVAAPALLSPSQSPLDAAWVPFKAIANAENTVSAGVGLTQIEDQTGLAGRVDAQLGGTRVQAIAAHTTSDALTETVASARIQNAGLQAEATVRDRNGQFSAEGALSAQVGEGTIRGAVRHAEGEGTVGTLSVATRNVQAAIAGVHQGDRMALTGQVAAQIGKDGTLNAAGTYEKTPEATRATLAATYTDATTDLGIRYVQEIDQRAFGGQLEKRFQHSTLGIGGDYLSGPEGDGGRVYGRWKTDAIGERAFGYQIRGEVEAGAMKRPGQDWNTYASGRIVGEKENASFFVGVEHQQGPVFNRPQTSVNAGFQIRF